MNEKSLIPAREASSPEVAERRRTLYNRTVREAKLVTINLCDTSFSITPEAFSDGPEVPRRAFGSEIKDFHYNKEDNFVFARIRWSLDLKIKNKKVAKCHADYNVIYDGFSVEDEDIIKLFVSYVAKPATYAYFRAFYAQLDWAAGLNSPPLPVVQFSPKV